MKWRSRMKSIPQPGRSEQPDMIKGRFVQLCIYNISGRGLAYASQFLPSTRKFSLPSGSVQYQQVDPCPAPIPTAGRQWGGVAPDAEKGGHPNSPTFAKRRSLLCELQQTLT